MDTFLATLSVFGIAMAAMAIGVILSNRRLQGSCGGTGQGCSCSAVKREACAARARTATGE